MTKAQTKSAKKNGTLKAKLASVKARYARWYKRKKLGLVGRPAKKTKARKAKKAVTDLEAAVERPKAMSAAAGA